MARLKNPGDRKRHNTERFRAPGMMVERFTNAKSAMIGYHLGRGLTYQMVADLLNNSVSTDTIRRMVQLWGMPTGVKRGHLIILSHHVRAKLKRQADKLGISSEEFLTRISECVIRDGGLYEAITDGQYDEVPKK